MITQNSIFGWKFLHIRFAYVETTEWELIRIGKVWLLASTRRRRHPVKASYGGS
jgi:hypothetical protein